MTSSGVVSQQGGLLGGKDRDFGGGPNLRDSASKLGPNEAEDSWNVTFDTGGNCASRKGFAKQNGTPFSGAGGVVHNVWWSSILGARLTQAGKDLYLADTNTVRKTFSTEGLVTFAEMNDTLVAGHPVDGLFTSSDGITWVAVADPDAPTTCVCLAVWQSKLWVGQVKGKVNWSDATSVTAWTSTSFNKLWEKDQQDIVAMHIGSGQDITGKPGLLVFKQESVYRINDSTSGSYTTVDATVGAASPISVIGVGAKVIWLSKRGVFWWREGLAEAVDASDKFRPLWDTGQVNMANQTLWAAGRKGTRARFSLTRAGSSANDLSLEYDPDQGWIAPRSDAMSCYTTSTGTVEALYGGSPTVSGQVYALDSGGTDDGTAISWRFQTRWFELSDGLDASLWQVRLHGRGSGTLTVRKNYASSGGDSQPFDLTGESILYDSGLTYDSGETYATPTYESTNAYFLSDNRCRQFSLLLSGSSSSTVSAPQVLGAGTAPTVGSFGLSGVEWFFSSLGIA